MRRSIFRPPSARPGSAALPPEHADLRESLAEMLRAGTASRPTNSSNRLPEFSARARGAHARSRIHRRTVSPAARTRAAAAPLRCGSPNASTAPSSARWRSSCRTWGSSTAASSNASRASARSSPASNIRNIARLYDAGVDERGRPYLALEYVRRRAAGRILPRRAADLREKLRCSSTSCAPWRSRTRASSCIAISSLTTS